MPPPDLSSGSPHVPSARVPRSHRQADPRATGMTLRPPPVREAARPTAVLCPHHQGRHPLRCPGHQDLQPPRASAPHCPFLPAVAALAGPLRSLAGHPPAPLCPQHLCPAPMTWTSPLVAPCLLPLLTGSPPRRHPVCDWLWDSGHHQDPLCWARARVEGVCPFPGMGRVGSCRWKSHGPLGRSRGPRVQGRWLRHALWPHPFLHLVF